MNESNISIISMVDFLKKMNIFQLNAYSVSDIFTNFEKKYNTWEPIENWENISDLELAMRIIGAAVPHGRLYIVSEASYKKSLGVFEMPGLCFFDFIKNHLALYGECLFNGDVLIFCVEEEKLWLFHHEGVFLSVKLHANPLLSG